MKIKNTQRQLVLEIKNLPFNKLICTIDSYPNFENLLPYFSLCFAMHNKKEYPTVQSILEAAARLNNALRTDGAIPKELFDKRVIKIFGALCVALQSVNNNANHQVDYPFVYHDYNLDNRFSEDGFCQIMENAARSLFQLSNCEPSVRFLALTAFSVISRSHFNKDWVCRPIDLDRASILAKKLIAVQYLPGKGEFDVLVNQELLQRKNEFKQQRDALIEKMIAANNERINQHYEKMLRDTLSEINKVYKNKRKEAYKNAHDNFQVSVAALVASFVFAPYLSGAIVSTFGSVGITIASESFASVMVSSVSKACISTSVRAAFTNDYKNLHQILLKNIAMQCIADVTKFCCTDSIITNVALISAKGALNAVVQGEDPAKAALIDVLGAALGEFLVDNMPIKFNAPIENFIRSFSNGFMEAVVMKENPITEGLRVGTQACVMDYVVGTVSQQLQRMMPDAVSDFVSQLEQKKTNVSPTPTSASASPAKNNTPEENVSTLPSDESRKNENGPPSLFSENQSKNKAIEIATLSPVTIIKNPWAVAGIKMSKSTADAFFEAVSQYTGGAHRPKMSAFFQDANYMLKGNAALINVMHNFAVAVANGHSGKALLKAAATESMGDAVLTYSLNKLCTPKIANPLLLAWAVADIADDFIYNKEVVQNIHQKGIDYRKLAGTEFNEGNYFFSLASLNHSKNLKNQAVFLESAHHIAKLPTYVVEVLKWSWEKIVNEGVQRSDVIIRP